MEIMKNLFGIVYRNNNENVVTQDIFETFGAFLTEVSADGHANYDALLAPPAMKPYVAVNFREEDGEKLPGKLPDPRYEPRDISLQFAIMANNKAAWMNNYAAFLETLKRGWLILQVPELMREFRVYYQDSSSYEQLSFLENGTTVSRFKVKFREPDPTIRTIKTYNNETKDL